MTCKKALLMTDINQLLLSIIMAGNWIFLTHITESTSVEFYNHLCDSLGTQCFCYRS
jgi:hypothetical protein